MLSEYGRKMVDAHKRRMAAKPKVIFLPADMREEMKHARVIAAVSEGRIRVEPTGLFFIDAAGAVPGLASELTKALETIGAKIAAYRALGKTMAKIPGPVSTRARELANIFTIVGGSDEAPEEFIAVAERAIAAVLGVNNAPGWQFVLTGIFAGPAAGAFAEWPESDEAAARWIADTLVRSAPDAPAQFRRLASNPAHLAGAKAAVLKIRNRPKTRGQPPKAWTLAWEFATAIGAPMSPKRSGAIRKRKMTAGD